MDIDTFVLKLGCLILIMFSKAGVIGIDSRYKFPPDCPYCACASVDGICREIRPGPCQVRRVFGKKHTFWEYYVMFYVSCQV